MERTFEDLRELVMKELDEIIRQGQLDGNALECVDKLVDIAKDIGEIEKAEMGYSQTGYSMYPYAWDGNSYDGNGYRGNSYRSGGYSRRGRDSMGRFTSNSYDGGMSNRGGYSRESEREEIMAKMGRMMDNAASETERQAIQRIMNQL